ncbi:MAG TPA: hypothetical protein PKG90_11515 [Chitinophagaceae bacterium]|nr:hypothetical protein [Chitinophagaceae bacterium]HNU14733.1 hypothetical protein [Chitinophagaceae bacterium]
MKTGVLIIFSFLQYSSLAQVNCIQVKGDDNKEVQYVSVAIKNDKSFYVSDDKGSLCEKFVSKIKTGDTILFSAIGYQDRELIYSGNDTIILQRRFALLPEVVLVNGDGEDEIWGTKKNSSLFGGYCSMGFSDILIQSMGRIVYPEGNFKKAEVLSISFYDTKGQGAKVPVRLRIYTIGKDSLPMTDYLTENIVVDTKKKGWITFNLKEKRLLMSKEGLAICLELFANSEDLYHMEKVRTNDGKFIEKKFYGFGLGMENGRGLTVMKYSSWDPWQVSRLIDHPCGDIVCKVKVKVWR